MGEFSDSETLRQQFSSDGISFQELRKIRSGVYSATVETPLFGESTEIYLKRYSENKLERVRTLASIAEEIGHPQCRLFEYDSLWLVMDRADGRPLSQLLPIAFLPGIWTLKRQSYEDAYFQIGKQVGVLHTETADEIGPVLDESEQENALGHVELLQGLPSASVDRVRDLLREATVVETPSVITYGDRSPHNIYFDGDVVTHIDCTCKRRSATKDHTSVLMGLRLMINRLPYARPHIRPALEYAYWTGYDETGLPSSTQQRAFAIRYIANNLKLLQYYRSGTKTYQSKLTSYVDVPSISKEIKQTIENLPE